MCGEWTQRVLGLWVVWAHKILRSTALWGCCWEAIASVILAAWTGGSLRIPGLAWEPGILLGGNPWSSAWLRHQSGLWIPVASTAVSARSLKSEISFCLGAPSSCPLPPYPKIQPSIHTQENSPPSQGHKQIPHPVLYFWTKHCIHILVLLFLYSPDILGLCLSFCFLNNPLIF